jgi:two-component system, NarL family, response regulator DesR
VPPAAMRPRPTSRPRFYLSEGTVRNYLSAAIRKLGARNRSEAIDLAVDQGWL